MSRSFSRSVLLACLAVAWVSEAGAQCKSAAVGPCAIVLHGEGAPRLAGSCAAEAWKGHLAFELPETFADGDSNGWHEVVLELDLQGSCSCAVFRVQFESDPVGHTVNIGDSPTNNGHGGDAWTTRFDAELMLLGSNLSAFGAELPNSSSESLVFGLRDLRLAGRTLELEVCDQSVRFTVDSGGGADSLRGFFNTYRSRELLAIRPPPDVVKPGEDVPDTRVYAAFNRVISKRSGLPSRNRYGSGVRRVEISLTP